MATGQQLLTSASTRGAATEPIKPLDLWTRSDASRLSVSGARNLVAASANLFDLDAVIDPGTQDFWVSMWLNPRNITDLQTLITTGGTADGLPGFTVVTSSDGRVRCYLNDTVQPTRLQPWVIDVDRLVLNTWNHIVITFKRDGVASGYLNGQFDNSDDISTHQATLGSNGPSLIGAWTIAGTVLQLDGALARVSYGEGVLPTLEEIQELYNLGHGKTYAELSGDLRTKITSYWNCLEAEGTLFDATDTYNDGTEVNGPIGSAPGPSVAVAADISGNGNRGTLINMSDDAWSRDTPDGTYAATKEDSAGNYDALMTNFSDVDAAHVDGPNGSWGPFIQDQGSGNSRGWLLGGVKDSRSLEVPNGFIGGVTKAFDAKYQAPPSDGAIRFAATDELRGPVGDLAGTTDFTISLWMRPDSATPSSYILYGHTGSDGISILVSSLKLLQLFIRTAGLAHTFTVDAAILSSTKWSHVLWTVDRSGNCDAYVNGALVNSVDISAALGESLSTSATDYVFAEADYVGDIGPIGIAFNKLFSTAEIASIYSGGTPLYSSDIDATLFANFNNWWDLSSLSDLTDKAGSSDLTVLNGSPTPTSGPYLPAYDCSLLGFTESPRSDNIPAQLSGVKSIPFGDSVRVVKTNAVAIPGQGARTVSCWFKANDTSGGSAILMAETDGGIVGTLLYLNTTGRLVWSIKGADTLFSVTTPVPSDDNMWHLGTAVFDGTTDVDGARVYIDGIQVAAGTSSAVSQGSDAGAFQLGNHSTTYTLPGSLCLPTVTAGRAWTEAEVAAHFANGAIPADATAVWDFNEPDTVNLDVDYSLSLNGTSQYVDISDVITGSNFTIAAWVKQNDWSSSNNIFDSGFSNRFLVYLKAGNGAVVIYDGNSTVTTTDAVPLGTWTHVCLAKTGTSLTVYINGVAGDTVTVVDRSLVGDNKVIGAAYNGSSPADANFSQFLVYNSTLTPTEIASLAQGNSVDSPVGRWEFDQTINLPYLPENKAITFDGVKDYLGGMGDVLSHTPEMTITHWLRTTSDSSGMIVTKGSSGQWDYNLAISSVGLLTFTALQATGSAYVEIISVNAVNDGGDHHVAISISDGNFARIHVDGVLEDESTVVTGTWNSGSADFLIGQRAGGFFFDGMLADPRIYDRALTEGEIRDLIAGTDVRNGLLAEWAFNDKPRSVPSTAGGYSLKFNGVDQQVRISPSISDSTNWSISLWFITAGFEPPSEYLFDLGSTPRVIIGFRAGEFTPGSIRWHDGSSWLSIGDVRVDTSAWTNLVISKSGISYVAYLNGEEVAVGVCEDTYLNGDLGAAIGSIFSDPFVSSFNGNIDDVRIYPTALTAIDVQALYAGGDPIGDTPAAHWSFNDGPQAGTPNDGDIITSLTTREGRNLIFTGVSAAQRPQWFAAVAELNNRPSLLYDGLDDCLEHLAKALIGAGAGGVFQFVVHLLDQGVTQPRKQSTFSQGNPDSGNIGMAADNRALVEMNADSLESDVALPKDQTHVVSIISDGTAYTIRVLTVQQTGGTGTWWDAIDAAKAVLGASAGAANGDFLSGYGPENLGYDRLLTNQEIAANEQYLLNRYGAY